MPAYLKGQAFAGRAPLKLAVAYFCLLAWVFACLLWAAPAFAQLLPVPELQQRVTDTTDTLDADTQARLTKALAGLEQRKGAQIAVLMVPTTGDEDIAQYAVRAFEQWKLGRAAVDDGILFLIAKDDRRLRIEVGYGLEGAVPDLLAGRIIREQVAPHFQQGDFAGGVEAGVKSLISLVDGEDLPPPPEGAGEDEDDDIVATLLALVFLAVLMPPIISVLATGVFAFFLFESMVFAVLAAMVALLLSLAGRTWLARGHGASASKRGGAIGSVGGIGGGWSGDDGGFGGGGFGGGGFGGGGGSSGGGGASGSW